jgi:hypothetical protein
MQGQPRLHGETLSQKNQTTKRPMSRFSRRRIPRSDLGSQFDRQGNWSLKPGSDWPGDQDMHGSQLPALQGGPLFSPPSQVPVPHLGGSCVAMSLICQGYRRSPGSGKKLSGLLGGQSHVGEEPNPRARLVLTLFGCQGTEISELLSRGSQEGLGSLFMLRCRAQCGRWHGSSWTEQQRSLQCGWDCFSQNTRNWEQAGGKAEPARTSQRYTVRLRR